MSNPDDKSALGPALFVGLILYALATGGPVPPPENPAERMDMSAAASTTDLARRGEDETPPRLPYAQRIARIARPTAPDRPTSERLARALPAPPRPSLTGPVWQPKLPGLAAPRSAPVIATTQSGSVTSSAPTLLTTLTRSAPPAKPNPGTRPQTGPASLALAAPDSADLTLRLPQLSDASDAAKPSPLARPMPPPFPATHPARNFLTILGTTVHLRAAPNARSQVRARLDTGALALAIEPRGNWTRVYLSDQSPPVSGWVYSRYLAPAQ
ncbi:hypothetical protein RXV86_05465 [Alisedimentitalea sp. MJ-SS2]|uniref:hypothetical protein n=1 Tax=Aliisedimentitalea sp. MJ-SS2 TaxID=3049795 RepID=UPI00290B93C4|nr:hypothetical protein [Alisedimentitalea sp. MJ-SS2]MDU8926823.1 hypothetical protein [Alisedimentitalea sp. MJ-SS2]